MILTPVVLVGGGAVTVCTSEVVKDVKELSGIVFDATTYTVVVEVLSVREVSCRPANVALLVEELDDLLDSEALDVFTTVLSVGPAYGAWICPSPIWYTVACQLSLLYDVDTSGVVDSISLVLVDPGGGGSCSGAQSGSGVSIGLGLAGAIGVASTAGTCAHTISGRRYNVRRRN